MVSDEVGWRKPRPDIFREAFRRTGVDPRRTLFVGDRADIDVVGAQAMGMDVAWINPGHEALPAGIAPPTLRDPRPGRARAPSRLRGRPEAILPLLVALVLAELGRFSVLQPPHVDLGERRRHSVTFRVDRDQGDDEIAVA